MLIFCILFIVAFLLDSAILPGIFSNYYGYLVSILFASSMVTLRNPKRLVYTLIIFGLIYELLGGYTLGLYVLPLLIVCLLILFADHYVNIRTYFMERGLVKYIIAPIVIIVCFIAMQYISISITRLFASQYEIPVLVGFMNWRFTAYLYLVSLIVFWLNRLMLDKYAERIQGNN